MALRNQRYECYMTFPWSAGDGKPRFYRPNTPESMLNARMAFSGGGEKVTLFVRL